MAFNDSDILLVVNYLQQTLSSDANIRKPAERSLENLEGNEGFAILLLHIIDKPDADPVVRVAAAVLFKNFIKRNWKLDDESKINENDRNMVKSLIIGLMLKTDNHIQRQLSDAVSVIGQQDFPDKWSNLLIEMVNRMQGNETDFHVINGILQTAHSLFKRYRHEFRSNRLWSEIKYVLDTFAKPFTDIFIHAINLTQSNASNPQALKVILSSIILCAKIFYSLNYQDLPEFFEDNISTWMNNFLALLSFDNKLLASNDDDEVGLLEQLKSQICDNIAMYAQKYHEEFQSFLPDFVSTIWNLLVNTGIETKYDLLVSNAIRFISTVADRAQYSTLFEAPNVLDSLCSKVIIPNIQFRESDEEMFYDNPEEYIRRDIEGSDFDTRRRAACDLIKSLSKFFATQITAVFSEYVNNMLASFSNDPQKFWKSKDAAIYLVTAISVKTSTMRDGATSTSQLVDIEKFFNTFVKPDLEIAAINDFPVLKADALKYLVTFRNHLSLQEIITHCLPLIVNHLSSPNIVIHTYAAHAIERIMKINVLNTFAIRYEHIQNLATPLIQNLFNIFLIPGSEQNEYAMKALVQTFFLFQENLPPHYEHILPKLTAKLIDVSKNPSKPNFNHYLFESLSVCIKIGCNLNPEAATSFEALLFPVFQEILVQDVQEFMPYVFQILSLLLESCRNAVPDVYLQLFPCLLAPLLWDRPANIHPLVRLFRAYLEKSARQIHASGKFEGLLGIFQKLIASRAKDHEGFDLLESMVLYVDPEIMSPYWKQLFVLMFHRLTNSKTHKFTKYILFLFSIFAHKYGANFLANLVDEIQESMFGMVVERLFIADLKKVNLPMWKKVCGVGITDVLTQVDKLIEGPYAHLWPGLFKTLINFLEETTCELIEEEEFVEIEEMTGYEVSYSRLFFASKKPVDPLQGTVESAQIYFAQSLHKFSLKYPQRLGPLIVSRLDPECATRLQKYLQAANVTLS